MKEFNLEEFLDNLFNMPQEDVDPNVINLCKKAFTAGITLTFHRLDQISELEEDEGIIELDDFRIQAHFLSEKLDKQ